MEQGAVFQNDCNQVVCSSKATVSSDEAKCVGIVVADKTKIIIPVDEVWESWLNDKDVMAGLCLNEISYQAGRAKRSDTKVLC